MSIDAIRLRNFRGFREATLDLKPLTVLLGPNSSGKSSFGHALSCMAHAHRALIPSNKPSLTPANRKDADQWPIDLGLLPDLRTTGVSDEPVSIGLRTSAGWAEYGFGLDPDPEVRLSRLLHPFGLNISTTNIVAERTLPVDEKATTQGGRSMVMNLADLGTSAPVLELHRINEREWRHGEIPAVAGFEGMALMVVGHGSGTGILMSGVARDEIRRLLEALTYLRAVRERPIRGHERGRADHQPIGYSGEWTASFLLEGVGEVRHLIPPRVPNDVEDAKNSDYGWAERKEPLLQAVNIWLRQLGLADRVKVSSDPKTPTLLDTKFVLNDDDVAHDVTAVGFGLSQVLPILAAGLAQPEESLFVVDLPEAHLHPRPQAELADFFCSLALSERWSLVETHSEMFFHRLRLRAEMHPELADRIAVYFVDPPSNGICTPPRRVGLRFNDELHWPAGFLQQSWEVEAQIEAVRAAKASGRP